MISIKSFVFNPFMENTYVLHDHTKECVIIDPGCYEAEEKKELSDYIDAMGLKVVKLLNTHCHIDHVLGNDYVMKTYKVGLYLHRSDEATLRSVVAYAPAYGFQRYAPTTPTNYLDVPGKVAFGASELEVRFTPGHAPGHVIFCHQDQKFCIGGDVLFQGSIGRTDLPGGNYDTLIASIKSQMFTLDDATVVHPGHGGSTTIGHEKKYNPYCGLNK